MAEKRFKLNPETIRELEEHDLAHIAGGATLVLPNPPIIRPSPIPTFPGPLRPRPRLPGPVLLPGGVPNIGTLPRPPWGWT